MKDRRKRNVVSWSAVFWCTLFIVFSSVLLTSFTFSTFRLFFGAERFHPQLVRTSWPTTVINKAIAVDPPVILRASIREIVTLPDQVLIFLNYPPSVRLNSKQDIFCVYFAADSSEPQRQQPPVDVDGENQNNQMVRCPLPPRGFTVSLRVESDGYLQPGPSHRWDSLVYDAVIDRDNTTVVFVKGLNLRPERLLDPSKFECVYGWDFRKPKFLLRSSVLSIAQEIARCKTPLSLLNNHNKTQDRIKVSIRVKGKGTLHSIASPAFPFGSSVPGRKEHQMCVCTMLRNQAQFFKEWVTYHAQIGVSRWFIYDNNSDDDIEDVIGSMSGLKHNISRHIWPWIKTQEAGFAHCALRARDSCEWVGFIDVDEFFHLPTDSSLQEVLKNQSKHSTIGEIRVSCYSFGPSGLKTKPVQGVMVGYTCRKAAPERHKSIVNPEALNSTLINVVHHFHLRNGFRYVNLDKGEMVINHYKYQVWEVFKEKFYRRVATYVADWQDEQNVGSKDRAPGLGTKAVKPVDWSSRFCEVTDTGLRDQVLRILAHPKTHLLPWQEGDHEHGHGRHRSSRKKGKHKGFL